MQLISDRLCIVGTSHIAKQSVREIKTAFAEFKPDVVAIELDQQRLQALLNPKQTGTPNPFALVRRVGLTGTLFVLVGRWAQKKFGNIVRTEPGSDMKAAYRVAKKHEKPVLLVDQPLYITLRNMKRWSGKEKRKMFWDLITSPFKKEMRVKVDLRKVPESEFVIQIIKEFRKRYPQLYKILVADRDRFMSRAIKAYHAKFPDSKVMLVIGAGHVEGVTKIIRQE